MPVTSQILPVCRGDTLSVSVTVTAADGTPYDPSLAVDIRWRMSRSWYSPVEEVLVHKELGQGIEPAAGSIQFTLTAEDTDQPPGIYYHELKIQDGGDVATVMTGNVIIKRAMRMGDVLVPGAGQSTIHRFGSSAIQATASLP